MVMFKNNIPDNKLFWIYSGMLMFTGFVLFVLSALLYGSFKELVVAQNSKESAPIWVWLASGGLAILLGSFWLCFYIIFEAAKKGLVDLLHKK
jgi:hypothetical protein